MFESSFVGKKQPIFFGRGLCPFWNQTFIPIKVPIDTLQETVLVLVLNVYDVLSTIQPNWSWNESSSPIKAISVPNES
jgi:hypothetical protein